MRQAAGSDVLIAIFVTLSLCGILAGWIADENGRSAGAFFCLGFFLGIFGVAMAIFTRPALTRQP